MSKRPQTTPAITVSQPTSYVGSLPDAPTMATTHKYEGTACVITSHNYGHFLADCLVSCLNQSRPFASITVVDDASTDDTAAVAARFADRGVRYVRGEWKNYSAARMAGVEAAPRTPLLLFVDADNTLSHQYHEKLASGLSESNVAVAYGQLLHFNEKGVIGVSAHIQPFDSQNLRRNNFADACSLVRREAFDQVGGWKINGFLTDWMMWLDMTRHGWKMSYVPEAILNYREHKGQMSHRRHGNWDIHVAPFRECCTVAVVTLFSGRRWALDRYFQWLEQLQWQRKRLHLVAVDNSNDPEFSRALKERLMKTDLSFSYVPEPGQALAGTGAAELAGSRTHRSRHAYTLATHLARLYAVARQHMPAGADFIWSVEDDIEPPVDGLHHLVKGLFQYPDAGAISGCARSRFENQWILWNQNKPLPEPPRADRYAPIDAAGFYCLLVRRSVFDAIAFRPTRDWSLQNCAYDWAATHDIVQSGRKVLASGSVRCKHWQEDGSFL